MYEYFQGHRNVPDVLYLLYSQESYILEWIVSAEVRMENF